MFVPTMPTFFPQSGQNFPMNPMNVPGAPYFTCPPEYLQFPFIPASPYGFPPQGYPTTVASNSSRRTTNGMSSDKECAMPSSEKATSFMPPSPYGFPPQGYPTMASNSSRRTSTQGASTNKECAAPSSERASSFIPASPYGFHPHGYPTMASNSSRMTYTNGMSTDKECVAPPSERAPPFMPASPYGIPYGFHPQGYPTMASNSLRRASSHGMSTDKECAAPSSERASPLAPQCSPQGLENNNLTDDSDSDDEDNLPKLKKVAYSYRENEHLAQCWADTCTDSVSDNAQKLDQMWMRIGVMYNKRRPANTPVRPWNTLKSHFYALQKQARSFCECYNKKVKLWGSGKTDVDIIELAQQEYKDRHNGQVFKHIGVWKLLNACPKFSLVDGVVRGTKKAKTSEAGTYTFSSNGDLSADEDVDADHIRPIGQKVAQKNVKGKGKSEELKEIKERIDMKMVGFEKYSEKKVAAISRIAVVHEYEILMKDTSNMTSDQLIIHRFTCDKIKKKWGM